jgi:hypothetical protein
MAGLLEVAVITSMSSPNSDTGVRPLARERARCPTSRSRITMHSSGCRTPTLPSVVGGGRVVNSDRLTVSSRVERKGEL